MKTYIYPENLKANVKLWFWNVRDFIIICTGLILSVVVLVNLWNIIPFAVTACYAFVTVRADEMSCLLRRLPALLFSRFGLTKRRLWTIFLMLRSSF